MGELGQLLREIREEKNVTLEEVESATRIRLKYLVALEEGEYDSLPTPGHVHGFLRNYAIYLGLDLSEVESLYAKERSPHRLFDPGIFHPKDIVLSPPRSLIKADVVLGFVVTIVVLIAGGWVFWQYGWPLVGPTPAATATPTATTEEVAVRPSATLTETPVSAATDTPALPTSTPTSPAATPAEPTPLPTPTATLDSPLPLATPTLPPTETPTPTPTRASGVVLRIQVTERAWLQVSVDGQESPGQLLQEDEEREWEAQHSIYFICGNAGGVLVTVNGEELGTLGERGEVVEKTWTPEGEVTPTPQAEQPSGTPTETPGKEGTPTSTPTPTG